MISFLRDAVTPVYQLRQPDLLCLIYDELNLPTPNCLRDMFSPGQKSDCSSVQPNSAHSESVRSSGSNAFDLGSRCAVGGESAKPFGALRRLSSFDSHKMLQINVGVGGAAADKKSLRSRTEANIIQVKKKTGKFPFYGEEVSPEEPWFSGQSPCGAR